MPPVAGLPNLPRTNHRKPGSITAIAVVASCVLLLLFLRNRCHREDEEILNLPDSYSFDNASEDPSIGSVGLVGAAVDLELDIEKKSA
jgi:hypothetical protein